MNLRNIVTAFGVPGFEDEIREIIVEEMKGHLDDVHVDIMGNVIGVKKGGDRKVMLAAHMDQIGFMVRGITEDGFLLIAPVGGVNPVVLRSSIVRIRTESGFIRGVIGEKPPHLGSEKRDVKIKDLRVDIGAGSREEAEKIVKIGDVGSFEPNYVEMNGKIVANSLDDRVGVYVLLKLMENVESDSTIYFVATVQEEIGLKGARTSSFGIAPDIGIAIDVTHATMPGVGKDELSVELGKGPVIGAGPISHPKVYRHIMRVARRKRIPLQVEANPSHSGTDADIIQLAKNGVATSVISIPERYMHSSVEMISKRDVNSTIRLLRESLREIGRVDLRW